MFTVDYSLTKDFFFQSPEGRDGATYQGRGRMQMTDRMRYTSQNNLTYSKTSVNILLVRSLPRGDEV